MIFPNDQRRNTHPRCVLRRDMLDFMVFAASYLRHEFSFTDY
jgi:hypothetical protein